ncbi:MAG: carboxypeptidase regulatory-like domain-containing protein [Acidobacteria bacterium]|nr:carboxypeptidase regulatory-like domain-containing protein [Acidobacteriota bacterium]
MKKLLIFAAICGGIAFLLPHRTNAAELLVNGGFETGNFTGWTTTNPTGSWQNWQIVANGYELCPGCGTSPFSPTPASPQQGTRDAVNGVTASANQQYIMYQDVTLPAATTAGLLWKDRFQMNLSDFCSTAAGCGQAFYFVEITNTSNVVLQTLYSVTAPPLTKTNTGWVNHSVNLSAYAGQTIRIRFRDYTTVTFIGPGQAEIDAVSVQSPFVPTASNVSVGGRVLTDSGAGISRVNVTLTDGAGVSRSATTNSFGYYKFDEVETGETYILTVNSKKYLFTGSPRVVNVTDNLTDIDFTASP